TPIAESAVVPPIAISPPIIVASIVPCHHSPLRGARQLLGEAPTAPHPKSGHHSSGQTARGRPDAAEARPGTCGSPRSSGRVLDIAPPHPFDRNDLPPGHTHSAHSGDRRRVHGCSAA